MVPEDWGINFSFSRMVNERWLPFVRAGWADEAVSLMQKSISVGAGFHPAYGSDQLGIGLNWGQPAESFGPDLDDQYALEAYYRLQLSDETALTPNVHLLLDPALNPDESSIWVFSLRRPLPQFAASSRGAWRGIRKTASVGSATRDSSSPILLVMTLQSWSKRLLREVFCGSCRGPLP